VDAVRKRNYEKAESLFYKAYLLVPDDPFTLNNLGYISELKGRWTGRSASMNLRGSWQPTRSSTRRLRSACRPAAESGAGDS